MILRFVFPVQTKEQKSELDNHYVEHWIEIMSHDRDYSKVENWA